MVEAVDVGSTGLDLNLMTRRGAAEGRLGIVPVPATLEIAVRETLVAVVVAGQVRVGEDVLDRLDGLQIEGPATVSVSGRGLLAVVRVSAITVVRPP
nr:environmental stress-induced protein Ves [Frigoribacterium sp. PvP032]